MGKWNPWCVTWSRASRSNNFSHSVGFPVMSAGKDVADTFAFQLGACRGACLKLAVSRGSPGFFTCRVLFPGCICNSWGWIGAFWSVNFSHCFSIPVQWGGYVKGEEASDAQQPIAKGHIVRRCDDVLAPLWPNSATQMLRGWMISPCWAAQGGSAPQLGMHCGFPHWSALPFTITL